MRRILKWGGIALAVLLLLLLSLPFLINVNQFEPRLESELSAALNREVKLGNLKLSLLSGEVAADDLSVAEDQAFGKPTFIHAKSLAVGAEIWPFLVSRKLIVTYLTIDQPEIALAQAPSGAWNFSSLGAGTRQAAPAAPALGTAPLQLSVKLVKITNGKVTLGRTVGHWKPLVLEQVNLELREFSSTTAFPLALSARVAGGGTIQLDGKAGPINSVDAAMTPVNGSLKLAQLDLAGSGMTDFAPDIAGLVSFEGSGSSDGRVMEANGKLKAEKLKLAKKGTAATRPVEFDFAAQHDLRNHRGTLRQADIRIGGATAHLTGSYAEQGESMAVDLKLAGPAMPVSELEALLPALGVVLPSRSRLEGGTVSVMLAMQGPADQLVTAGSLALEHTKLTGFDLPKRMASIEKLAGIHAAPDTEIEMLAANVRVAPDGTNAQDMKLVVPAIGDVSGAGTVSPANDLAFTMVATMHTSGALSPIGNAPIPFTVQGTCADPVFRPDLKAVAKDAVESLKGGLKKQAGGLLKDLMGGSRK
jgi:AsmA protein